MPLHPRAQKYLEAAPPRPPLAEMGAQALRVWRRQQMLAASDIGPPVGRVADVSIDGPHGTIPLRIYEPAAAKPPYPALVYLHGGGWVTGDLDAVDPLCRLLCERANTAVVSVDYRLAPEHPYPVPLNDAYAALEWTHRQADLIHVDRNRLAVGGDSSGATLALAAAFRALDHGTVPLSAVFLAYPPGRPQCESPSYTAYATGYGLSREDMKWYWAQYLPASAGHDADAAPLERPSLRGLPPTVVVAAEYDVLRSDVEELAARLAADGVDVHSYHVPGMIHGFLTAAWASEVREQTVDFVAAVLRGIWARQPGT